VWNVAAEDFMGVACRHQALIPTDCKEATKTAVPFKITAGSFLPFCLYSDIKIYIALNFSKRI
jgi:hypothetical protein